MNHAVSEIQYMVIEQEQVWIIFLPGPVDLPSLLLEHSKLVSTAGSYSMSPTAPLPYAQNKDGKAAEDGKCCCVGSTNAVKL